MFLILNFSHCFDCVRIHRVAFKVGFCQWACLRKYFGVSERTVISLTPWTPCGITVKIISSYVTKKINDFIGVIILFYTFAAKFVKCLHCSFFFFNLRHSEQFIDRYGKHLSNGRNQLKIGISIAVFPTADRLIRYTQAVGKCFLRQIVFLSKITDVFTDCKFHICLLYAITLQGYSPVDVYIIPQESWEINNAFGEKNYCFMLY